MTDILTISTRIKLKRKNITCLSLGVDFKLLCKNCTRKYEKSQLHIRKRKFDKPCEKPWLWTDARERRKRHYACDFINQLKIKEKYMLLDSQKDNDILISKGSSTRLQHLQEKRSTRLKLCSCSESKCDSCKPSHLNEINHGEIQDPLPASK